MSDIAWHNLPVGEVTERLKTDNQKGLTESEVARRFEEIGPNELREQPRPGFWQHLLDQFKNFVVLLLVAAAIISGLLGEVPEALAILLIVVLNAILGVVQEGRAEQALAALKKLSSPDATVVRDGHQLRVPEREVVPGDVVLLEAGNYVPADVRLVETANLKIAESSLTGESLSVNKEAEKDVAVDAPLGDRKTMAYRSTIVNYGRGKAIVVGTGMQTEIGKIADMIQSVDEEDTPLQVRLEQLGKALAIGALIICGLVFAIAFGQVFFDPESTQSLSDAALEAFLTAVALAIAAVPEGLPAIVTINLALGMREMVKRNALIRRLPAVETLGSASAICSDKTGTLTQNMMTAVRLYVPGKRVSVDGGGAVDISAEEALSEKALGADYSEVQRLLTGAMLCSDASVERDAENGNADGLRVVGDPTETALVMAAAKGGLWREEVEKEHPRVDEIPFDSTRKRMTTLHKDGNGYIAYVKGAPDVVIDLSARLLDEGQESAFSDARREHVTNVNRDMAQDGLRVLAVAFRRFQSHPTMESEQVEKDLTLVGFIGIQDPARPEVGPAIAQARDAGIRTVMVTGDYPGTAQAIAKEIGLLRPEGGQVVSGAELEAMSDDELATKIDDVDVFARVSPAHKVRIVEAFLKRDYVVAMTGDGVNDAPALKRASIGVAMGITGTDVSKETADMVLTDDNFRSIVSAVEQGRIIYSNIRKFVYYLLSANVAEIVIIFVATLLGFSGEQGPLTAIQLLWLNLVTDGAPALALGVEKGEDDVMERPPRATNEPIIDYNMRVTMGVLAIFISGITLAAFFIGLQTSLDLAHTMAFVTLSVCELFVAYTSRSELHSVFEIGPFKNKYMQYAVGASLVLILLTIYVPFLNPIFNTIPLGLSEWQIIIPLSLVPAVASEVTKFFLRSHDRRVRAATAS